MDDRPWELPGAVRRDCALHRGNWLVLFAVIAFVFGIMSCMLLPALIAVPLGIGSWILAERDLVRIRMGKMDPSGWKATENACAWARAAITLGLGFCAIWALLTCLFNILSRSH